MDNPKVFDQEGQEQDWGWLQQNFGGIILQRVQAGGAAAAYRIVRVQDAEGAAALTAAVVDEQGRPLKKIRVARSWPDAPDLPSWPSPVSIWRDMGVYGETDSKGRIGFGMGRGDYYTPPGRGASCLWVADETGPSDLISGLGMLGLTNHRHLDITFQRQGQAAPEPEPEPEPLPEPEEKMEPPAPAAEDSEQWRQLYAKLDEIATLLEKRVG